MALSKVEENFKEDLLFNNDLESSVQGDIAKTNSFPNLKQAVLRRLLTVPGSFAFRPSYGVGLPLFQNELSSIDNQRELMHRIVDNFKSEPRIIELTGLKVVPGEKTTIELSYRPVGTDVITQEVEV